MQETEAQLMAKLDEIAALLKIGFESQIQRVRNSIEEDPVKLAALELAQGQPSGELVMQVVQKTGVGKRTVEKAVADLAAMGALRGRRDGNRVFYSSTGLL